MNEVERLAYLSAMGIESYIPRIGLPGALPSVVCEMPVSDTIQEQKSAPSENAAGKASLKELQSSLASQKPVNQKPVPPKPVVIPSQSAEVSAAASAQINVRFHWTLFQPVSEMLLLVPIAHTDQYCIALLKKILSAIGVVEVSLVPIDNFVWPPSSGSSLRGVAGNGLHDARETLQAFLEGYQLKQKSQQQMIHNVLVFDGNLGKTLFEGVSFPDMQLRILPSLQLMLNSTPEKVAEAKQFTWQRLKDLKK